MSLGNTVGTHLNLWNTLGTHLEYTWNTFGIHLEHTWNTLGIHSEYTWNTLFSRHSCFFWIWGSGGRDGRGIQLEYKFESLEEFQVLKNTLGISLSGKMDVFLYLRDIHTEHGLEKSLSGIHLEVPFEHTNSIHLEHKQIILDISNVWLLWVVVTLLLL